jgi:FixJ family two-component response regulator
MPEPRVFLVDDDPSVLRGLERFFRSWGYAVETFDTPDALLARLPYNGPACVVIDLSMPSMTGLDVQDAMRRKGLSTPLVFLSGQSNVRSTATAMRGGAVDFLEKPPNEMELLDAVSRALSRAERQRQHDSERTMAAERVARLTTRERQVCELVATGLLNKQIASELGTSEKTVKVHRGRVMHKLQVDSVASLVRLLSVLN